MDVATKMKGGKRTASSGVGAALNKAGQRTSSSGVKKKLDGGKC